MIIHFSDCVVFLMTLYRVVVYNRHLRGNNLTLLDLILRDGNV